MTKYIAKSINKKIKTKSINAFTLAEILIALLVIGIVTSLTIPALLNHTNDSELKAKWKKTFAEFSQVYYKIKLDHGDIKYLLSSCSNGDHSCFKNALKPYFNVSKDCNAGQAENNCFLPYPSIKHLNKTPSSSDFINTDAAAGLVLANGTNVILYLDSINCDCIRSASLPDECGWATFDVNGNKPPNTWGRDIFSLQIYSGKIQPLGAFNVYSDQCSDSTSGRSCSLDYLTN